MSARLQEFIDPEELPRAYGGSAPDVYKRKANSEFPTISRGGVVERKHIISGGKALKIDVYAGDGAIDMNVSYEINDTGNEAGQEVESTAEKSALLPVGHSEEVLKHSFKPGTDKPERLTFTCAALSQGREYKICWKNPTYMASRSFIYTLTEVEGPEALSSPSAAPSSPTQPSTSPSTMTASIDNLSALGGDTDDS